MPKKAATGFVLMLRDYYGMALVQLEMDVVVLDEASGILMVFRKPASPLGTVPISPLDKTSTSREFCRLKGWDPF